MRLAGYDQTFSVVSRREGEGTRPTFVPTPGWRGIELDEPTRTVRIPPGTELDLGATAKALAADRAARLAAASTGAGVLVSIGGDVAVAGAAPQGGWPIRIADDHAASLDTDGPVVSIVAGGLASSSTSVRRWKAAGADLHHLIDPRTGRPATTPWRTATVAAASCVDANTASTAAFILGDEATEWLEARALPSRLVTAQGSVVCVGGWSSQAA